jgi:hypothetical protein
MVIHKLWRRAAFRRFWDRTALIEAVLRPRVAVLRADVIDHLVTTRDMPPDRVRAGLHRLATASSDA